MFEERTEQGLVAGDPAGGAMSLGEEFVQRGRGEVRERVGLGIAPDLLDRIEFRGLGGQQARSDLFPVPGEPGGHRRAVMRLEAVPDEFDRSAPGPRQGFDELPDRGAAGVGVGQKTGIGAHAPSLGGNRQGAGHRDLAPRPAPLDQDRGLAAPGPTAAHQGRHQKARLVHEDDRGRPAGGVFFTLGQVSCTQRRIASSSRSRARRAGFCGLKPN